MFYRFYSSSAISSSPSEVEEYLSRSKILLFMKGSPESPRCRFSRLVPWLETIQVIQGEVQYLHPITTDGVAAIAEAVEILRQHQVDFDYIDVLEHPSLRLGEFCWWFGTFCFPHILGISSPPIDKIIFFRGVAQPPTRLILCTPPVVYLWLEDPRSTRSNPLSGD